MKDMKKLVIGIFALLLVGAAAFWYFRRDSDKARDVLPADASTAMMFEPAELVEGLGLTLQDVLKLASEYGDMEGAVDFTKPVYAFASENGFTGIALNVEDATKLLESFTSLGFASEQKQGLNWVANNVSIGCFDDDKILLCQASAADQDGLRGEMMKLMKQDCQDVPILEKANRQEGFLRLCTSMSSLPKSQLPPGYDVSGAFLSTSLSLGKQDITLSAKVEDKDGKPYSGRAKGEELLCPINGLLLTVVPDKPFAWFCMGVKGEQLLKILRVGPQVSAALMAMNVAFFDADLLLKAIDGDVVVMMPKADFSRREVLITANISNSDFLKNAEDWDTTSSVDGMSLRKRGENDYVFTFHGMQAYFGVRGGMLYIASSERMADQVLQETENGILQPMVAGKYICGSIDVAQLVESYAPLTLMLSAIPQLREVVTAIDKINLSADTPQSLELSIKTNKPVKDVVSNLMKLFRER